MIEINTKATKQKPDKIWLVTKESSLSYGQQWQRCIALLAWCEKVGIEKGDFVLVAVTNELEQASLLTGLICIGRVPIIIDPESTISEVRPILDNLVYSGVLAEPTIFQKWRLEESQKPYISVITTSKQSSVFGRLLAKKQGNVNADTWPSLSNNFQQSSMPEPVSSGLAYLIFTSGTTSKPKGVEISRRALLSQMNVLCSKFELVEVSRILNTLPMHHVDGFVQGPLLAWVSGCTAYRPVSFSASNIPVFMDSIYRECITHMIAVPTMLALILRLGKEFAENFKSPDFRFIISCAGHLESNLWEKFEHTFDTQIVNLYGLTETVTSALICGPDPASRRLGSLGLPINCDIQIIDESGLQIAEGECGELLIAGDQLMQGYHRDPVATSSIMRDGWLYTGDLVKSHPGGHVELVGRLKNLIISGGRNISPEEVAAMLNQHPSVLECAVLGCPDPDWGETVAALVVLNGKASESDMVLWCRERLSEYKIPRRIIQVAELEKGPSGKIRIEAAREQLSARLDVDCVMEDVMDIESAVLHEAARCFRLPVHQLSMQSGPDNTAGWNSLEHMELVLALEDRFGFKFTAREIMQIDNLGTASKLCRLKA